MHYPENLMGFLFMEIFKDVPGYEGSYQVSDLGRVKSLKFNREKILKPSVNNKGYLCLNLCDKEKVKNVKIHQLVVMAFLNHAPDGTMKIIVDHIDNDKLNNRLSNLQLISVRENTSKDRKGSSKYTGVCWSKNSNKWMSSIEINGKSKFLGYFDLEEEANKYYQNALKSIEEGTEVKIKKHKYSSKYKGVFWRKQRSKWVSQIRINGKLKHLGSFDSEEEASKYYQDALIKLNKI